MTRTPPPHPRSLAFALLGLLLTVVPVLAESAFPSAMDEILATPEPPAADIPRSGPALDRRAATRAIVALRQALPAGWDDRSLRWDAVPTGWHGQPQCLRIELAPTWSTPGDGHESVVWLLPPCWEGRMEVSELGRAPAPLYLGENEHYRVLHEPGDGLWPDAARVIGEVLALTTYPLSARPEHQLDVNAMQRLYRRLDGSSGRPIDRWLQQIYGIEELDRLVYVELLTWDERDGHVEDPTWLGEMAENETRFLSRATLAAFPDKHGIYLRRVTSDSFSDVIVVNPAKAGT